MLWPKAEGPKEAVAIQAVELLYLWGSGILLFIAVIECH